MSEFYAYWKERCSGWYFCGVFGSFWVQISARTPAIMTGFILLRFSKTVK
jgi:hypothetical protein